MKPHCIELPDCEPIPILYENRPVLAVVGCMAATPRRWF